MKTAEYQLHVPEVMESLLCLDWKREGIKKVLNIVVLSITAGGSLIGYAADQKKFFLLYLAGISVLLMFLMLYLPALRRKNKASSLCGEGTKYKFELKKNYDCVFESEHVFTVKKERDFYCVPKRVFSETEVEELRKSLKDGSSKFINVKTEREVLDGERE